MSIPTPANYIDANRIGNDHSEETIVGCDLKSPFNIRTVTRQTVTWNSVTVSALEIQPFAGKAWHEMSSERSTLSIMLEHVGGRCELRRRLHTQDRRPLARHINYIPPGMEVWGYTDHLDRARKVSLLFDYCSVAAALGEDLDAGAVQVPALMFADERISAIGELLAAECARPDHLSSLYGESLITALFTNLLRFQKKPDAPSAHSPLSPWQLRRSTEFMRDQLSSSISLADLAAITGLSQSRFGRGFKASTGLTPFKWLLDVRIQRAQLLLLQGDLPLPEVALSVGFAEQSHFTRAFRHLVGTTPGDWRRHHKGR